MGDSICSSSDEEEILTYKLRIHDADISDSGKWQCEVKDKYGTVSTTCDLDVFGKSNILFSSYLLQYLTTMLKFRIPEHIIKSHRILLYLEFKHIIL